MRRLAHVLRHAAVLGGACLSAACATTGAHSATAHTTAAQPTTGSASGAELRLLHFNDVYEIAPVEGGRSGGLARVATLRRALRDSAPGLITTLGGDYLSPSALGTATVGGSRLAGRQMVATLNALGLDVAVLGNHEFDVSESAFKAHLARARFRVLAANVTDAAGRTFPGVLPHLVLTRDVGGRPVRVAFVGVVIPSNRPAWARISDPLGAARDEARRLRDSADVLVALTHLSVDDDIRLIGMVPEFDLVLGGHEHENYTLRRGPRLTPLLKADANARTVQVISIAVPPNVAGARARPTVAVRLQPVTDAIPDDPSVGAVVAAYTDSAFAGFAALGFAPRERVATVGEPLDGREATVRGGSSTLTRAVGAALAREAFGASSFGVQAPDTVVWVYNGGSIRIDDVLPAGPVTQYDVIRILPFGGRVLRVQMRGALLRRVLEQGVRNAGSGGFLQTNATRGSDGAWTIGGRAVQDSVWYPAAINDFLLTGQEVGLGFLTRANPDVRVEAEGRDVRQGLIEVLRARWPQ